MPRRPVSVTTVLAILLVLLGLCPAWSAQMPVRVVATFSILGDLVAQVGGDRIAVSTLVRPDADAHGYTPAPSDARTLAAADLVVVNGLGLEGWIDRLIQASGAKAPIVVASTGVSPIDGADDHGAHAHDEPAGHNHQVDPHAWQSIANTKIYVANIRDGLSKVDPDGAATYAARASAYLVKLDGLEGEVRSAIAAIPPDHRRIITTHDAFGYFSAAYGLKFIAPQGVSTDSEASPRDVARIIRQIRRDRIPAVFLENIADPRLMQQIARESGAIVGGKVYSDALSAPGGPAPDYLGLMRNNLSAFSAALGKR